MLENPVVKLPSVENEVLNPPNGEAAVGGGLVITREAEAGWEKSRRDLPRPADSPPPRTQVATNELI